jgi:uncharacterized phiE125 gp8 family phage protein
MLVSLLRTTEPATEPVISSEMEAQLVLSSGFDAARVTSIIKAARQIVETDTERSLITQTWTMKLKGWPKDDLVYLFKSPVQTITSVTYLDTSGSAQTLDVDVDFKLNTGTVPYLSPIDGWPSLFADDDRANVTIVYVAGYGVADDVPDWAKQAILAKGTLLYTQGQINTEVIYNSMIRGHRIYYDYLFNR